MKNENKGVGPLDFIVSILKYSVATWINFILYGASLLLVAWFIPADVWGQLDIFLSTSVLIMNVCILGLDQSFMRFYNEPPNPLDKKTLLGTCFATSSICLAITFVISFFVFPQQMLGLFFAQKVPTMYVVYLFINAFMSMVGRYVNLSYRMSGSIFLYTLESVLMQFFSKVFFVLGGMFSTDLTTLVLFAVGGMSVFGLFFLVIAIKDMKISAKMMLTPANKKILPYGIALMPTAVMLWINGLFSKVYISKTIGVSQSGVFSMVATLSNVVAIIQAGFATFWSAFIYANYKTEQEKIKQVHDYLTFLIVEFFCVLIIFEDVIFWILGKEYHQGIAVFPIMVLVPVFLIISETTVYGISIAQKPIYDTIGIAISVVGNIVFCLMLAPSYGLYGVAIAFSLSNFIMFVFRTIVAQKFYCSIPNAKRTMLVCLILFVITYFATILYANFTVKAAVGIIGMIAYILIYQKQLKNAFALIKQIFTRYISK